MRTGSLKALTPAYLRGAKGYDGHARPSGGGLPQREGHALCGRERETLHNPCVDLSPHEPRWLSPGEGTLDQNT